MNKLPLAAVLLTLTLASAACGSPEPAPAPPPPVESPPASPSSPAAAGLPPAADGTNLDACRDGACQVSVTGTAQTVVNGRSTKITIRDGRAQITMSDSSNNRISSGLRPGNTTTLVSSGHKLVIRLIAARDDSGVLQFSAN